MAADLTNVQSKKKLISANLSKMTRGTFILRGCDIEVILAQITSRPTFYSRSQIFVNKYKILKTFDICYKHRRFFHRPLVKAVRNPQSKQIKN